MANVKSTNFTSLFPEVQQNALQLQQQQELAQALMKQGSTPIDPTRSSGRYIVPISPLEGLAKIGTSLAGAYMQKGIDKKQADLAMQQQDQMKKLFGLSGGNTQATPWVNPDTGQVAPGTGPSPMGGTPGAVGGGASGALLSMPDMSPQQAYIASQLYPDQFASAMMDQYKLTNDTKRERELGITPDIAKALQLAKMNKEGTIDAPGGNVLYGPNGSMTPVPDFKGGTFGGVGRNGQPYVGLIPGAAGAQAALAGAIQGGKEANTVFTNQTVDGRENVPVMGSQIMNQSFQGPGAQHGQTMQNNTQPNAAPQFGMTPIQKTVIPATQSAVNEDFIKNAYRPTVDAGNTARKSLADLQVLDQLNLKTGWGTDTKATAANILTSLGIAPQEAKDLATNSQMFNNIVDKQVGNYLQQQKGPQTEGDAQRAHNIYTKVSNTNQANDYIRDLLRASNNMQIKQANFYQKNYPDAQNKGDLTRIENDWYKNSPSIWDDPVMNKWNDVAQKTPSNAAAVTSTAPAVPSVSAAAPSTQFTRDQAQMELRRRGLIK